jgi:hypothetical protein
MGPIGGGGVSQQFRKWISGVWNVDGLDCGSITIYSERGVFTFGIVHGRARTSSSPRFWSYRSRSIQEKVQEIRLCPSENTCPIHFSDAAFFCHFSSEAPFKEILDTPTLPF